LERLMKDELRQAVEQINVRLALLLEDARSALRGEREFGVENIGQLRIAIEEMIPILAQPDLRRTQPEIASQLDLYKSQLNDLQTTIHKLGIMLVAHKARLDAGQSQNVAVSRWVSTLGRTR
jgi:hypothetical protein